MESKGEARIRDILERESIPFQQEASFTALKGYKGKPLRFDFKVEHPILGTIAIEWHGIQHYQFIKHFHKNTMGFKYRQQMDVQKASYCLVKKIPLFVIPYTEYENIKTFDDICQDKFRVTDRYYIHYNKP